MELSTLSDAVGMTFSRLDVQKYSWMSIPRAVAALPVKHVVVLTSLEPLGRAGQLVV
jgi:hypothetical protein